MKKEFNEKEAERLTNIARPIIANDIVAMFASEEDLLFYEHFFIKGMEYVEQSKLSDSKVIKEK